MNKQIVVIRSKALLPSEKLFSLEEKLRHDYETGFIFVPCYCEVFIADEVDVRENLTIAKITRPIFNREELEKARLYWYNHLEVHNEEQNKAAWAAINAINYCLEHSSGYQKGGAE